MFSSKLPSVDVHLLPLGKEVWRKVMFLLASVILFIGVLCMMSLPVYLPDPMFLPGGSLSLSEFGPCPGGSLSTRSLSRGLCPGFFSVQGSRESLSRRPPGTETPRYGKERAVRILLEYILEN